MELQIFLDALTNLIQPYHLMFLFLGTALGLVVGVLPGLGGLPGIYILLTFVFDLEASHALAMMIGLLAPSTKSDTVP